MARTVDQLEQELAKARRKIARLEQARRAAETLWQVAMLRVVFLRNALRAHGVSDEQMRRAMLDSAGNPAELYFDDIMDTPAIKPTLRAVPREPLRVVPGGRR